MKTIILASVLLLAGCGQLNTFVAANEAGVVRDAQTANDNMVHGIEAASCAVPIGAVIRNPEFIPIAEAACMPSGTQSNPVSMFQSMQSAPAGVPAYEVPSTTAATAPKQAVSVPAQKQTVKSKAQKKAQIIPPAKPTAKPVQPVVPVVSPAVQIIQPTLPTGALP